jgi:hypothetical protein
MRVVACVDLPTGERGSKEDGMAVDLVADNDGAATYRRADAGEGRRETRQREGSWEASALWERGQVLSRSPRVAASTAE